MARISDLLSTSQGIIFAEDHRDPATPRHLAQQMRSLAKAGVKVLFTELFNDSAEHAQWLEAFDKDIPSEAVEAMKSHIDTIGHYYPPRTPDVYHELLQEARANGIKLAGVPPARSSINPIGENNPRVAAHIAAEMKKYPPATKYALYCGKDHTHAGNEENMSMDQARGIDLILGAPCVMLASAVNSGKTGESALLAHGHYPNTYHLVPCEPRLGYARKF